MSPPARARRCLINCVTRGLATLPLASKERVKPSRRAPDGIRPRTPSQKTLQVLRESRNGAKVVHTRGAQRAPPPGRPPLNEESRCPSSLHCFPRLTSRRVRSRVARSSSSPRWPAPEHSSLPPSPPAPGPRPPTPPAPPEQVVQEAH